MPKKPRHRWRDHQPTHDGGRRLAAQQAVERIYRSAHGDRPDFTRFDRRLPRWRRWAVAGGLIALATLAIVAWAGFLLFGPAKNTTSDLAVTIDAPPAASIGDAVTYRVTLINDARVPVAAASLDVRLPEDFLLADADPQPDDTRGLRWTLGALDRGDHVTITLRGHLYGTPEQPARITATAVYRPGNFNADFETRSEATTILGASPIALTLVGPPRSVPGTDITYTIHAAHTGTTTSPVIRIALDVPRTFVLRESNPKRASEHELAWVLSELTPGAERTITVRGHFTAGAATPYDLRATATITPSGGRALTLSQATTQTEVLGSAVALLTTVNDQTSGFSAHAGDTIRFRIVARNDGAAPIRSLVVRTVFDATSVAEKSILNFGAITDSANGTAVGEQLAPRLRRGTVTWTATEIPTLADVAPGEQRTIDLAIPLHTPTTLPGMSDHGTITFHAALTVGSIADTATPFTITTTPIAITVQ